MEMDALIDIPLTARHDRRKTHFLKRTKRVFNPQNPEEADRYLKYFLIFMNQRSLHVRHDYIEKIPENLTSESCVAIIPITRKIFVRE